MLALLLLLTGCLAIWLPHRMGGKQEPIAADFAAFYTAGHMLRSGETHIYEEPIVCGQQRAVFPHLAECRAYLNPPLFAKLLSPLAALPYPVAAAVWIGGSIALVLLAARGLGCRRLEEPALLAFGFLPFWGALFEGQGSPLAMAVWSLSYLLWSRGQSFLAGLATALLFFKFHLATGLVLMVLMPPASFGRAALGVACGWSAVLAIHVGLLAEPSLGFLGWLKWAMSTASLAPPEMPGLSTVRALVLHLLSETSRAARMVVYMLTLVIFGWGLRSMLRARDDKPLILTLAIFVTLGVSPHGWFHDWTIFLAPIFAVWAERRVRFRSPWTALYALMSVGGLATVLLAVVQQRMLGWNHSLMAAPVVLVMGVWWFHFLRRNQPRRAMLLAPPLLVRSGAGSPATPSQRGKRFTHAA